MSYIKNVSRYFSPEVEYLVISCRPHYLPREFSSILFIATYSPPQTDAGTKTALNRLYKAVSKQENAHPEWPGTLIQANLNQFYQIFTNTSHVQPEKENPRPPFLYTEMHTKLSPSSIWQI
jgi:hypothetical protein